MIIYKTPFIFKKLFPSLYFNFPDKKKVIFLTFDDGPDPEVTPWVLSVLNNYNAKATFFCIGNNVQKYTKTYKQMLDMGHHIGNHTYDHLNGWKTNNKAYLKNIESASNLIETNLFRPPYGKIKPTQIKRIKTKYHIIIWDILCCDFKNSINNKKLLNKIINHSKSGTIITFHDTKKSFNSLKYILPKYLNYFSNKGYSFKSINLN